MLLPCVRCGGRNTIDKVWRYDKIEVLKTQFMEGWYEKGFHYPWRVHFADCCIAYY
jgi:hypothetical protein